MKNGNWIALHKELCYFLPHNRPYTLLEAMFSYTLDMDKGKEGTISGYSKQWGWSRCKVRRFVLELKTGTRQVSDRDKTGARHHISLKINNLQEPKDTIKTPLRQELDSHPYTTIKPNPKPNPKKSNKTSLPKDFIISDRVKKWAEKNNHTNLEQHLENFKIKALAKGYTYVDWDSAFQGAIRDNWANLTNDEQGDDWATPEQEAAEEARRERYEESKRAI